MEGGGGRPLRTTQIFKRILQDRNRIDVLTLQRKLKMKLWNDSLCLLPSLRLD